MNRIFLLLLLSLFSATLYAQTPAQKPAGKVWTLRECVEYALANNLDVQRSTYGVESASIDHKQAKMAMIPSLNAGASSGFNWGRSINPVTNLFTTQEVVSLSPNANSSVTLFNGFRLQNNVKQTGRDLLASEYDLEKSKNDVSLNVINLYINVIFNKELVENARFQLSSTTQQLERTKKLVAAGSLPKSDELNLDAQVATNEVNLITNENSLNFSLLQLKQALQLPATEPFDVEVPNINVEDLILDQTSEQIFDIARATMPEMKSADLRMKSSYYAVQAAKGNLYPRLTLNANVNSNYSSANNRDRFIADPDGVDQVLTPQQILALPNPPDPTGFYDAGGGNYVNVYPHITIPAGRTVEGYSVSDQLTDNIYRSAGVTLSIPIFNGFQVRSAIRRSLINQRTAELNAKQTNNTLRQNVENAYNDAYAASKTYNSNLRQVQAREEAFRMTKQRFDIGATNYVEYQVAENELFRAKSDLARAKYNFIFRKKLLDFYQGKPLGL
jgi:outer membrane protein